MALPLAPIAVTALRFGAVAAVAYYVARKQSHLPTTTEEAAHEDVEEGVSYCHSRNQEGAQANADARIKRTIRFGAGGPGIEIDATALGRIRFRKV